MSPRDVNNRATSLHRQPLNATPEMCHYCFDLLLSELLPSHRRPPSLPLPSTAICPLFITWDKRRSHSGLTSLSGESGEDDFDLRGCIGTLSPRPLVPALREYALTSAFRDRRFEPIRKHEVPFLRVAVSLLVNYEDCSHCYDWVVGVHGILIKFACGSVQYSATYLPEVPVEQGWNQQETIQSLTRKAGYMGVITNDLLSRIQCTRYQSSKEKRTFEDYVGMSGSDPFCSELPPRQKKESQLGWRTCMYL